MNQPIFQGKPSGENQEGDKDPQWTTSCGCTKQPAANSNFYTCAQTHQHIHTHHHFQEPQPLLPDDSEALLLIFVIPALWFSLEKKIPYLEWYSGTRSQLFRYRCIRLYLKQISFNAAFQWQNQLCSVRKVSNQNSQELLACTMQNSTAQPHRGNSWTAGGKCPQLSVTRAEAQPLNQL